MTADQPTSPPRPLARGQQPGTRRPAWFWIIGGFALLLLILAAAIVPDRLSPKRRADEDSAIQTMRTIREAEMTYNSTYPANGYACSLPSLGGDPASGPPNAHAAQLIDPALAASGYKSGYTFALSCTAKVTIGTRDVFTSFEITAIPQTAGKTGNRGFCLNDTGDLKYDPTGGVNCTKPLP